jgi:transposase-like protein
MKQTRRKWSVEQKLQMIQESVTEGVNLSDYSKYQSMN